MIETDRIVVIIPAAGSSSRMGSGTAAKQFTLLSGVPLLVHTLRRFEEAPCVDEVIVVSSADGLETTRHLIGRYGCRKVNRVVVGGRERQDSVSAGLQEATNADIVMVHDAARPFVHPNQIEEVASVCRRTGAAILGVVARDTVKEATPEALVVRTLDRQRIWLIQTPQAFKYDLLFRAHEAARTDGFVGTDDAALVERLGIPVCLVEGSQDNIKITVPEDWKLAESILRHHPEWNSI